MKRSFFFVIGVAAACLPTIRATPQLTDNFDGSSLNSHLWSASTPFPDSSVAVNGGDLVLTDRGRVLSTGLYSQPYDVSFRFAFTGSEYDSFKVFLRSDGTSTNPYGDFDKGIVASFRIRSDPVDPAGTTNNIELSDLNYPTGTMSLARGTFALSTSRFNEVRIRDTGSTISLYLNGQASPFLSATTTDTHGAHLAMSNREGGGGGSWISNGSQVKVDYFAVRSVSDSGSILALMIAALGAVYVMCRGRRRVA